MPDAYLLQIEAGEFALTPVDSTVPGYSDAWQTPGGILIEDVTLADYEAEAAQWTCQVTSGALTPSPDTTTTDVPPTFCMAGKTIPTPGETSFTVDISFLQDPQIMAGLSHYLYEQDTFESYFLLGFANGEAPRAAGRCRVNAGAIGGAARTTLTADVSLPCSKKPQVLFGDINASEAVPPSPAPLVPATGATAGSPGTWTPAGSTPPADAAGATATSVTASPLTTWATGEYVQGSTAGAAGEMHWSGTAWTAGQAP